MRSPKPPQTVTVIYVTELHLRAYCCIYGTEIHLGAYCHIYGTEMHLGAGVEIKPNASHFCICRVIYDSPS